MTAVDGRNRRSTGIVESVYALPLTCRATRDARRASIHRSPARFARSCKATAARRASTSRTCAPGAAPPGTRGRASPLPRRSSSRSRSPSCARSTASPPRGQGLLDLLGHMLLVSDNEAANQLEVWLAGSTSAGCGTRERDDACARDERLAHVRRLRGAPAGVAAGPIPIRIESQPSFGVRQVHDGVGPRAARPQPSTSRRRGRGRCRVSASAARRPATCSGCWPRSPTTASSIASSVRRRWSCTRRAG